MTTPGAYPIDDDDLEVVHDELCDERVVVFVDGRGGGAVFHRRLTDTNDTPLSFDVDEQVIVDREAGSHWDLAGRALNGPLEGRALHQLPSKTAYWFAVLASEPDVTLRR